MSDTTLIGNKYFRICTIMCCFLVVLSNQLLNLNAEESPNGIHLQQTAKQPDTPQTKLTISKATTYITAPLDELGFVNYEQAINDELSAGVNPEKNAFIYYLQAVKNLTYPQEQKYEPAVIINYEKKLGRSIPPGPISPSHLSEYLSSIRKNSPGEVTDDRTLYAQWEFFDQQANKPWKRNELPTVKAYLDQLNPTFELIKTGTQQVQFYAPVITDFNNNFRNQPFRKFRRISDAFVYRIMLHLGEDILESALEELITFTKFSRDITRSGDISYRLFGDNLEKKCYAVGVKFVQLCKDEKLLRKYLQVLENLPEPCSMAKSIGHVDHVEMLDLLQNFIKHDLGYLEEKEFEQFLKIILPTIYTLAASNSFIMYVNTSRKTTFEIYINNLLLYSLQHGSYDWNLVSTKINAHVAQLQSTLEKPRRVRKRELDILYANREIINNDMRDWRILLLTTVYQPAKTQYFCNWFIDYFYNNPVLYMNREEAIQTRHVLQKLSISLKLFQLKYHKYPDQLNDLAPEFASTIPTDLFAEAPLKYSKVDKGFVLYSVGANEQDDAGKGSEDNPQGDDIVVSFP